MTELRQRLLHRCRRVQDSIVGVAFQNQAAQGSTDFDIELLYSALSAAFIAACRSESLNFARFDNGITYHVAGCHHTGPGSNPSETFVRSNACGTIEASTSYHGKMNCDGPTTAGDVRRWVSLKNVHFGRTDWLDKADMGADPGIDIERVVYGINSTAAVIHRKTMVQVSGKLGEFRPRQSLKIDLADPATTINADCRRIRASSRFPRHRDRRLLRAQSASATKAAPRASSHPPI